MYRGALGSGDRTTPCTGVSASPAPCTLPHAWPPGGAVGNIEGRPSTHPLVVHVGQDPCHQLHEEDHQQQAEILGARGEDGHPGIGPGDRMVLQGCYENAFLK